MGKRKTGLRKIEIFLIVIGLAVFFYFALTFYWSKTVFDIVKSSYANYGENNPYSHMVSDEHYRRMGYRASRSDERELVTREENKLTFPLSYYWDGSIKSTYWYSYARYHDEDCLSGSWDIPVTVTFAWEDGAWCIVDYYEPA